MMTIQEKIRQISQALIQISVASRRLEFRQRLERLAFKLVEEGTSRDHGPIMTAASTIKHLVEFGKTIYEVEPINARIIVEELKNLESLLLKVSDIPHVQNTNIKAIFEEKSDFSDQINNKEGGSIKNKQEIGNNSAKQESENLIIGGNIAKKDQKNNDENKEIADNSAMRQSAIFERMRQFGNKKIQLRDLIAEFPKVSDRTVRYDLQKLCRDGLIERMGAGGPGTYYRVREI